MRITRTCRVFCPIAKMVCMPRCVMHSCDIFQCSFSIFFLFASKNALLETIEKRTEDNGTPKRVEELENVGERANNGVERSGRYSWG